MYNATPESATVTAAGPVLLDEDWVARTEGWQDDAERSRAYLRVLAIGARIATSREEMEDGVQSVDDLVASLTDWHHAGELPLPSTLSTGVAARMIRRAARAVWANVQARREREWDEMMAGDAAGEVAA